MMKFKSILFTILICCSIFIQAQVEQRNYYADNGLAPRERSVDFTHLKLEVSFVPEKKLVKGTVVEDFVVLRNGLDSLFIDGIDMKFMSVRLDGAGSKYKRSKKGLTIYFKSTLKWDSKHQLIIEYEANPKKGLYFIGWDDESGKGRKQIWTQGQGIDNRHWIPMYDEKNDKLVSEMVVVFDEKYEVLSNGLKLKEKKASNGNKVWHYKMSEAHAPYLIMLGIGEFEIKTAKSKSGIPMNFYYYPGEEKNVEPTYKYSVEMFDFFEKEIGVSYPWKTYSQIPVQEFMYGAMENTTATIFGDFYLVDSRAYLDRNYIRVNAHELAHQWFGDMVTARSSAHHWLQESFATHYDLMYQGEAFGIDFFDWKKREYNKLCLDATKKDLKPIAHSSGGYVRHYPKGALVLQMLKKVIGRAEYNAVVKHYLESHPYGNVDSEDLLVACHERLGLSLDWFWEQWVYKGGEPKYSINFKERDAKAIFNVKQTHARNDLVGLFKMPINFEVYYTDGSSDTKREWIEYESQQVELNTNGKTVEYVLFDPNSEVLKSFSFNKSTEMLKAQASKAKFMIDRFDAVVALGAKEFEGKENFLIERFKVESFHGIKNEIVKQIMPLLNESTKKLMQLAISDEDVEVRKAALAGTVRIPAELEPEFAKLLSDSSYQVIEKALNMLSFYYPQNTSKYLSLTEKEFGNRSKNVRIAYLKIAYSNSKSSKHLNELVGYTSMSHEFRTRINAANALKELNVFNEEALKNMLQAGFSFNSRLWKSGRSTVDHFFAQSEYKRMILDYVSNQTWTDIEFKKVNRYIAY